MIWKCQFVRTFLIYVVNSCRIRYDFLFTTLWLVKNSPLRAQSKLMINSMIKMSLRVLRCLLSLRRYVVINTRWQKCGWNFVLCHEIGLSHERYMDICLEASRLAVLNFDSQKNTGHENRQNWMFKDNFEFMVFHFFFSLICRICMTDELEGGILNLKSLIRRFNVTCGVPEN